MAAIKLKVDPSVLKSQATAITKEISNIEKKWQAIESAVKHTKGYWEGDASDVHQKRYSGLISDVQKMINDLKDRPDELLKMAGLYEETESKNVALAHSLSTDVII